MRVLKYCILIIVWVLFFVAGCRGKGDAAKGEDMNKVLKITWQRLVSNGKTCPRCGSTEEEIEKAISTLKQSLIPLGIKVILEKTKLSVEEFKKDPLQSNRIWLNDRTLESWIGGKTDQSPCCDICGPSECRTVEVDGQVYETIPANLIIRTGLLAASELYAEPPTKSCLPNDSSAKTNASPCCPVSCDKPVSDTNK